MRKINLCMVVNNLDVGGLEKLVLSLLRHLDRSRFELHLICIMGKGKLFGEVDLDPENVLILQKRLTLNVGVRIDPKLIADIRRFLAEKRIDIIHVHNLAPLLFAGLAARSLSNRPRVVYSEHNQINRAGEWSRRKFWFYALLADEIIAVSHDLETILVDKLRILRRVQVIHNGIDGAKFEGVTGEHLRAELGIRPGEFVIGTAVVLSEQKGIRYLLEAAEMVRREEPAIRFLIAGDGPIKDQLLEQARTMDLGDRVSFLGYRRDIPELLSLFDAYVLPSLWEGLPLALLEALALGQPVLCTPSAATPR